MISGFPFRKSASTHSVQPVLFSQRSLAGRCSDRKNSVRRRVHVQTLILSMRARFEASTYRQSGAIIAAVAGAGQSDVVNPMPTTAIASTKATDKHAMTFSSSTFASRSARRRSACNIRHLGVEGALSQPEQNDFATLNSRTNTCVLLTIAVASSGRGIASRWARLPPLDNLLKFPFDRTERR